ncbi:MAG: hypothetical protein VXY34_05450 [Bdellovibrionota bacterium]|nr:hypothetical protein [Bdellovibrionota bacterium]
MVKSYLEKRWFNFYKAPKALSISVLGAILSFNCFSQATIKPNIINLTSQKTSRSVSKDIPETNSRVSVKDLKRHSIGVGIGQTFLSSELGQNGDDSITLDLYYDYSASYSFDLIINLHHSSHRIIKREATITGLAVGVKGRLFQFDAFSPFLLGGLGFYAPTVTRLKNNVLEKTPFSIAFGSHFGAGGELKLNEQFKIAGLIHFHNPFDIKQDLDKELEGSYYKLLLNTHYTF